MKALTLAVALSCAAAASAQDDPGKAAFSRACETCHGPGASGTVSGPALLPMTHDLGELRGIVRQGVDYMPAMPQSTVSDADLDQIYAYLKRLTAASGASSAPRSGGTGSPALSDIRSRLDTERLANDSEALRATADAAATAAAEFDLTAACAVWTAISQSPTPSSSDAARIDDAIARVDRVIRTKEQADVFAFRAALNALRASLNKTSSVELDATIAGDLQRAQTLEPDDPRVVFLAGVSAALAPELAGGVDAAENELRRAETLLANARPADMWPLWKSADAAAWLGRVRFKRGDVGGARKAYERALELEPSFRWITRVLLPELTR